MTTKDLEARFRDNIKEFNLIEANDTIIIGTSGGPDSMYLASMLNLLKDELNLHIILAHLNHLHRDVAVYDEKLVETFAKDHGLDIRIKRASMDTYAKIHKLSPEDSGRRLRYEFFNEIASEYKNSKIAVAHIMDDQAETFIMRMIRGTGLKGLTAMDFKTDNIIRPILNFKKSEILAYLDEQSINYAIDQTNLLNDYTRNYIRNEIIPLMEDINPKTIENIFQLSRLLREDMAIIDDRIDDLFNKICHIYDNHIIFNKEEFESLARIYQTRLLIKAINQIKGEYKDFSKENIDEFLSLLVLDTGKKIIKDDLVFEKNYKSYNLRKIKNEKSSDKAPMKLNPNDEIKFGPFIIKASLVDNVSNKNKSVAYFDLDKLSFPLIVRSRANGDKFIPEGFGHNKKLKDFFIDNKIDKAKRDELPIILSRDVIIWIGTLRKAQGFGVDDNTNKILKIEVTYDT